MARARRESKFEVFGQEMLEKVVAKSGSSGRVYLPPDWIGKRVKGIRVERGASDAEAVRWDAGGLTPTGYRVSFQEYWDAIGGPRYNASRIYMLDLAGINRANPNFEVTRHLGKRCDVWLDSGGREPEEVMDGYMLDVERVVAGSKTLASLDSFTVLYALSSEVLPCLDWDGRVVWREPPETLGWVPDVAEAVRGGGFFAVWVVGLRRLGSRPGAGPALPSPLLGRDLYVDLRG